MYKSFKFRLYPDNKQLELLNKSFGCTRFIYIYYLSNIKNNGCQNKCVGVNYLNGSCNRVFNLLVTGCDDKKLHDNSDN